MSASPWKDVYLVVGGSGFLGRHIVQSLKNCGDAVSVFDIVQRHDDVPFYAGDISEAGVFLSAVKQSGATCIIHTASPPPGLPDRTVYARVNVEGTKNVIDAAVRLRVRKLVYTSSAGVVFTGADLANAAEDMPYPAVAMDVYNETKARAEQLVVAANGRGGLQTVVLRLASIYGPGDRQVLRGFVASYRAGRTHVQMGSNTNLFDWTYVGNVVHAHLLAAVMLDLTSGVAGEIFFVTNGDPIPFWDLPHMLWARLAAAGVAPLPVKNTVVISRAVAMFIALIAELVAWATGKEPILTRFRVKFSCATRWHSIEKARRILGYKPFVGNEEGIERTVKWWIEQQANMSQD